MLNRRQALWATALPAPLLGLPGLLAHTRAQALPARTLQFPRDLGSHPDLRTEWWYVTGEAWAGQRRFGFQLTFFRSRVETTQNMQSAFAAKQLVFAHAAITDLDNQRLLHDQRIAREGFGIALAAENDTELRLRDWRLQRHPITGHYHAQLPANGFALNLSFAPTQALLLQGQAGLSRKGPEPTQASYYYSEPQLAVSGNLTLGDGRALTVEGTAWLDHEWSEALMHPEAEGWDWIGMNLLDGSALTAFRLRRSDGSALWAGGSWRAKTAEAAPPTPVNATGQPAPIRVSTGQTFQASEVRFEALRFWQSPRSAARYPVHWRVHTPAGVYEVLSLLDDQELDSRSSTGAIYWEGLSELRNAQGQTVGRGYLEMTGYAGQLRL